MIHLTIFDVFFKDILAQPGDGSKNVLRMFMIVVGCYVLSIFLGDIVGLFFFVYFMYILIKTRSVVRSRYNIPEKNCGGCEDCMCAFFCTPCVVNQMADHTADYNRHNALCCSATGISDDAMNKGLSASLVWNDDVSIMSALEALRMMSL